MNGVMEDSLRANGKIIKWMGNLNIILMI
jgi:hypothetical protein